MNGNFRSPSEDPDDGADGLDPELLQLFDQAATTPPSTTPGAVSTEAFTSSLLLKMQRARRLRLLGQIAGVATTLLVGAFLAPQVAQQTLLIAAWLTDRQSEPTTTFIWPLAYMCTSLVIWRIGRRARIH